MFLLQSTMSAERAYAILQAFTPCPEGTCVAENDVDIQYDLHHHPCLQRRKVYR